jgi:tellurite resistance protein
VRQEGRTKYFPISFFSTILGMAGLAIAFQKAEQILQIPIHVSWYIVIVAVAIFCVVSIMYLVKIIRFKDDVKNEFNHPVKLSFFPTFSISLLLLSIAFLSENMFFSKYLWIAGASIHFVFTVKIISIWIQHTKFELKHMNPAWFIPAVGNILVPVAGVHHAAGEISWFFFSIGLFFWIVLLVIFFNRIIFHHPLPDKLLPTLFILIAPPAVGFISLVKLTGGVNEFSKILYYFGLFIVCLLCAQINLFRKIKFYLSWWAYSFPLAAITIATIVMFHETNIEMFKYLSWILFVSLNGIVILLLLKTMSALVKKEICVEEE